MKLLFAEMGKEPLWMPANFGGINGVFPTSNTIDIKREKAVRSKKLRNFLCLFHIFLCALAFNQRSFAGTWADAFEDDNTHGWETINNINNSTKWWIDAGEAVCETFALNIPSILVTGEVDWKTIRFLAKPN